MDTRATRASGRSRLLVAVTVAVVLVTTLVGSRAYAAPSGYPVTGIDVSAYQGSVNWASAVATGIRFAYIRASEQADIADSFFDANYRDAKANGLYAGAYHRARPDVSGGRAQAAYFLDHARYMADGRTLPPMLDIEWPRSNWTGLNACYNLTPAQLTGWMRDFVDEVKVRTGRLAMVYTNPNWWGPCTNNDASFGAYPLFNSGYLPSPPPVPAGWTRWTLWQYTSSLTVPGISGSVDGDVFNGTPAELAALAGQVVVNDGTDFADLDGDRRAEVLSFWAGSSPQLYGYLNVNGYGPIDRNRYGLLASGFRRSATQFADLDADGRAEAIVFFGGSPPTAYAYHNVNGFGPYAGWLYTYLGAGFTPANTRFADVDGDGRAEAIVFFGGSPPTAYAYHNVNGFGPYVGSLNTYLGAGFTPANTRFADLDADGRAEAIVFFGGSPPTAYAYHNVNGYGPYVGSLNTYLGAGFTPANTTFADLDADGRPEAITFLGGGAGQVYAYQNVNGYGPYAGWLYTYIGDGFRP
jgi:GH25 family lysozyme M1 (1,4-beta-N-acetylmuramidase)